MSRIVPRLALTCVLLLPGAVAAAADPALEEGERLLDSEQFAAAAEFYRAALERDPDQTTARLGLARAYHALGEYALALIEFETVLGYDNLPRDMLGQSQAYDEAAGDIAAGSRWATFFYAEAGIGNYRENSSTATDIFGGAGNHDTFLPLRAGGGGTALAGRHTFNTTLDYRFRWYDDSARRNDSDLRWNVNLGRPMADDRLRFGMRGRVSYRGDGQYRNDWGAFADYRLALGERDQLTLGGELRERRYPQGPLRSRTRDVAEFTLNWSHALPNGDTSVSLGGNLGQEWATQDRPDGDASFWGINGGIDHAFSANLDAFFWWSYLNEAYDDERPDFTDDAALLGVRNDDLWNFGGGFVWAFADGWSLQPTLEYNWEESNLPTLAYSSTELWVTVRKSF